MALCFRTVLLNALLPLTTQRSTLNCKTWIPCSPFPGQTGMSSCRYAHPTLQVNSSRCSEELHPSFPPGVWTGVRKASHSHSCHAVGAKSLPELASRLSQGNSAKPWLEVPKEAVFTQNVSIAEGAMAALQQCSEVLYPLANRIRK